MKLKYRINLIIFILLSFILEGVATGGNITTVSGDLFLKPNGGTVWIDGELKRLANQDFKIYTSGSGRHYYYSNNGNFYVYSTTSPNNQYPVFQFYHTAAPIGAAVIAGPARMNGSDTSNEIYIYSREDRAEIYSLGSNIPMDMKIGSKSGQIYFTDHDKKTTDYFKFDVSQSTPSLTCDVDNGCDLGSDSIAMRNIYAYTFVDKTPFFGDGEKALNILDNIKSNEKGNIDHDSLHEFIKRGDNRDIGAMVSVLTAAVNELKNRNKILARRIRELEAKCG